ncbi:hypothetical protein B296_00012973 [Ensete ventricosum]|uniref:Uncharacterized protein n=1 Tax=Ensete ventricosum TaxID=4639 RepID=A0A427AMZ8_ENSVE|nr:hypothetical protein B296_00012973 [Ensete ventricosum]
MFEGETSDGAEELIELGFGLRVHTDDDDEGDETVVGDHLGLLHRPSAPLLHALGRRRPLLRSLGSLPGLPFPFERSLGSHGSSRPFPSPLTLASIADRPLDRSAFIVGATAGPTSRKIRVHPAHDQQAPNWAPMNTHPTRSEWRAEMLVDA